jgi:hypothetical protein
MRLLLQLKTLLANLYNLSNIQKLSVSIIFFGLALGAFNMLNGSFEQNTIETKPVSTPIHVSMFFIDDTAYIHTSLGTYTEDSKLNNYKPVETPGKYDETQTEYILDETIENDHATKLIEVTELVNFNYYYKDQGILTIGASTDGGETYFLYHLQGKNSDLTTLALGSVKKTNGYPVFYSHSEDGNFLSYQIRKCESCSDVEAMLLIGINEDIYLELRGVDKVAWGSEKGSFTYFDKSSNETVSSNIYSSNLLTTQEETPITEESNTSARSVNERNIELPSPTPLQQSTSEKTDSTNTNTTNNNYLTIMLSIGTSFECFSDKYQDVKQADDNYYNAKKAASNYSQIYTCEPCKDCGSPTGTCYETASTCSSSCYAQKDSCLQICYSSPDANYSSVSDYSVSKAMMDRYYSCTDKCETQKTTCIGACDKSKDECFASASVIYDQKLADYNKQCDMVLQASKDERNRLEVEKKDRYDQLVLTIAKYCKH